MKKWTSFIAAAAIFCFSQKGSAQFILVDTIPAPSNLARVSYDSNTQELTVSWQDNTPDETGFVVFLSYDGGATWSETSEIPLPTNTTSTVIPSIDESLFPYIHVVTEIDGGISLPSNIISVVGNDPLVSDTDGDGMLDAFEVTSGLNPLVNDAYEDLDGDRYPNIFEYHADSDVNDALSTPLPTFTVVPNAPQSGNVYPTIQGALDAVDDDFQIILVSEGTYKGTGNRELTPQSNYPFLLISETGAATTIVDAEGQGRGLTLPNSSVVDGFTFKNGSAANGGGIQVTGGSPVIINSVFLGNNASQFGGAIHQDGGSVSLLHCTVLGGSSGQGGSAIAAADGEVSVLKSIIWVDAPFSATNLLVSDSIVKGGLPGNGNLASDPLLTPSGHLTANSPAIDKGNILLTSLYDMDGEIRPAGSTTDIGADEFADTDSDGLPDWWELKYFGSLTVGKNDDPDGDNKTNLQEYENGSNPQRYYDGEAATITKISGDGQVGPANARLPEPLVVKVVDSQNQPLNNISVTFTATEGGQFAFDFVTPQFFDSVTLETDSDGTVGIIYKQPAHGDTPSTISAAVEDHISTMFQVRTAALVAHWRFEDGDSVSTQDSSGVGNNASASGLLRSSGIEGEQAALFSGSSVLRMPFPSLALPDAANRPFSIGFWFYADVLNEGSMYTLMTNETYLSQGFRMAINYTSSGYNHTKSRKVIFWSFESGGSIDLFSQSEIEPDRWYHVVMTYDGGHAKIYIDGVLEHSVYGTIVSPTKQVSVGAGIGGKVNFRGKIDDLRVYSKALTVAEVEDIHSMDLDENGLPDWWEKLNFSQVGIDPTADPDGDGLSNLQEYHGGSNPQDFYSQEIPLSPTIKIIAGDAQTGEAEDFLPIPFRVKVTNGDNGPVLVNAPITMEVATGDGKLSPDNGPSSPLEESLNLRTDSNGMATAYFRFPASFSASHKINISAGDSGNATFTAYQELPYLIGAKVAAGDSHTIALATDGTLWGWGYNGYGQVGDGTTSSRYKPVPMKLVPGLGRGRAISVGTNFNAVIDENGALWTWGYNGNGQLGDGSTTVRYNPTKVNFPANTPAIIAVECGHNHVLALAEDGGLWAWGYNAQGALGNGTTQQSLVPVPVTKPSGMGDTVAIAAGYYASYALDDTGKVWAWGYGASGRLGDGGTSNRSTPVQVDLSTGLPAITEISAKRNHVLAYGVDGKIWAWGENSNGQLGDGTTTNRTRPVEVVSAMAPTDKIAAGYYHSLVVSDPESIWAWGNNSYGQIGDDSTVRRTSPVESQVGTGMTDIIQLSGGYYHSMALTASGNLWAWGYNSYGRLGDGTTTTRRVPTLLSNFKLSNDDSDSDGLPDSWEYHYFGGLSQDPQDDFDGDGLTNEDEYLLGLNPALADSDKDGMPDGYEVGNGFDPLDDRDAMEDFDGDRIPNLWEYRRGTSPLDMLDRPVADRIVDPSLAGSGNYVATIQAAVNAAPTSSSASNYYNIVEVRSGVYSERVNISSRKIVLLGELGATPPIIQSDERNYQILNIYDSAVIDGFRITRPKNSTTLVPSTASAILVSSQHPSMLSNLIIDGNRANYGGAIQKDDTGRLAIHHATIFDTAATYTGNAIYATNGKLDLVNSIIWAETNPAPQQIYSSSTEVTVSGCIIRGGERGGLNSDPLLTPEGWLKKSSLAIGNGEWSHVAHDIHGELRDAPPSIGADEFIDSDDDGLPDWYENMGVIDPLGDNDGDGLTNLQEYETYGTNATVADTDGDGLNDSAEIGTGSDPLNPDSDNDGMPDGYEVANGLNPLVNDAYDDLDGDRIPNIFEYKHGWKVSVAGRDPDPNNSVSSPPAVYAVDALFTNDDPINNQYRTIQAAVNKARASQTIGGKTVYPNRYAVIDVKSGVYVEKVNVSNIEVLLLAELGGVNGPVEVRHNPNPSSIENTIELYSPAIMDGFVITHAEGRKGRGVYLVNYQTGLLRRLVNCIIRGNTGASEGGAISNSGTNLELVNCTIFGNSSVNTANAIYNSSGGTIKVRNSILWNEGGQASAEIYPTSSTSIQVADSIIKGGQYSASGSDPLLNYYGYLMQGSPAINTGGTGEHLAAVDIHGEQRPDGSAPDMGADEFVDTDSDGLPDWWEAKHFGSATASAGGGDDSDSDSVSNLDEYIGGLDPQNSDTDGDGLNDGAEISIGSDPQRPDTDNDGMPDGWEVDNGLNPTDASDALNDNDGDRVPNLWEYTYSTDPNSNLSVPVPTRVVAPSGGDHNSLSAAQYAADDLEIIEVKSGVYEDELNSSYGKRLLWLGELGSPDGLPTIISSYYYYSTITLNETTVVDGFSIESDGVESSGIYTYRENSDHSPHIRLVNCMVKGFGGEFSDVIYNGSAHLEFIHCSIVENKSEYGAVIYNGTQDATISFVNSIIWNPGSSAPELLASNNQYQITNSIIRGQSARGAIDSDPSYDRYGNLMLGSPAIAAGTSVAASRVDIHGEARPGSAPDIGADQYIDSDADGLPDWWEIEHFEDLSEDSEGDPDNDQLTNYYEYLLGFDPNDPDTYGTGRGDYFEALIDTSDPWYPEEWNDDPDGDGVSTYLELLFGFDPNNPDTAGVGISDGALIHLGYDPNETDWDGDGISNADEIARGLNPFLADSDGDGVPDGADAFPLDPNRSTPETGDINDTTPPEITLLEPMGAVLIP